MQSIQRILVGVDFHKQTGRLTPGAQAAIHRALTLHASWGAELEFLHSLKRGDEDELPEGVESDYDPERGQQEWRSLCDAAGANQAQWTECEEGPVEGTLARVARGGVDLVLVAKRNRSRGMDRKLGSVCIKLLQNCPGPVWVVQPDFAHDDGPVLAATDLSIVGNRAVAKAAQIAAKESRDLVVVHAWKVPLDLKMSANRLGVEAYQQKLNEMVEAVREEVRRCARCARNGRSCPSADRARRALGSHLGGGTSL